MKNASNDTSFCCAAGSATFAIGSRTIVELRVLHVLQHHALGALLADDALVVGQVEGGGLHAAVAVAGREDDVDDADRRQRAELAGCGTSGSIGRAFSSSCSCAENACSFFDSASSRTVMNASNAAL